MLQSAVELFAYVTSDSLHVFFVCNLIILVVLVSSMQNGPDEQKHNAYQQHFHYHHAWEGENVVLGNLSNRDVSIIVKDSRSPQKPKTEAWQVQYQLSDEDMLRLAEERSATVQHSSTCGDSMENADEPEDSSEQYAYESNLSILETPQDRIQIQPVECDDLVGIRGMSFHNNCNENYSDEIYDHVEEDDQFRKRVEAFISKVNDGLRAEMRQTAIVC